MLGSRAYTLRHSSTHRSAEAGSVLLENGRFDQIPHEAELWAGTAYLAKGWPRMFLCAALSAAASATAAIGSPAPAAHADTPGKTGIRETNF